MEPLANDGLLALFLQTSEPAYACVCFDSRWSKAPPQPFSDLAEWGTKIASLKFAICYQGLVDVNKYQVSRFPLYVLFKCGPDFREIGRLDAVETGRNRIKHIKQFILGTIKRFNDKQDRPTPSQLTSRDTVEGWLGFLNSRYNINLELEKDGTCSFEMQKQLILFRIEETTSFDLISFIGEATHDRDPFLLSEILCWNLHGPFMKGTCIGFHKGSSRFTLKARMDIDGINAVTFENLLQNFFNIIQTCDQKIKETKSKREEGNQVESPSQLNLRDLRMTFFT
uniref:Uncharacterized protein n=1 Tax=Trieres chinensis TaxID=1514140 RepID=A0A7S1ZEK7_TRICV